MYTSKIKVGFGDIKMNFSISRKDIATFINASLMVDEGVGYALCLDKLVNTTGNSSLCFRPLEPRLEANLDIVWKKYQAFFKATEIFLQKPQEEINDNVTQQ